MPVIRADETLDDLRLEGLKLVQQRSGYRFSLDALLVAHYADVSQRAQVADLGTGAGVIALILATRYPKIKLTAVEVQADLAELAQRNVALNGLEGRVEVVHADWRRVRNIWPPGSFDVVVSNPPFRRPGAGRLNPALQKAVARHEIKGGLSDLLSAASYLLKSRGHLFLVHLPERLPELCSAMQRRRLALKHLRFVHPHPNAPARHILLHAVKDAKPETRVAPPLFIYNPDGSYNEETKIILGEI